jgi:aldehyde dehydrogenase (NAD+)
MVMFPTGRLYIDGKLRDAEAGRSFDDIGPWTGEIIGQAADASIGDMEEAIGSARRAFDHTDWSTARGLRREKVVRLLELMKANRGRLSDIARHEVGAALATVYGPQVGMALANFEATVKIFDEYEFEQDCGHATFFGIESVRRVIREPMGVVGAITAWNVPLYMSIGKIVPALLAGCTVILKPAPETPLMGAIIGELAAEVALPAGVLNVLTGKDPALLGELLVKDPRVDMITFTGSTGVGKRIAELGGPTLKKLFLELGGKSAAIILDDAPNYAAAVGRSLCVYHAGQGCAMTTRLLLPRSRYEEGLAILKAAHERYEPLWGDFAAPSNVMGPLSSARHRDRVMACIEVGKAEGARLLHGGKVRTDKGGGFFVEPTTFVDVDNNMRIAQEEIFGPVLVVIPYEDDEDAIRIANDSSYGLAGSVVSGDIERAMKIARRIRAGTFSVNGGVASGADMPFGGYKQSGLGREWGKAGFEEYLQTKALALGV